MKPQKWKMIVAIIAGIIVMLIAKFAFHIRRHSARLGFAAMLLVLILFSRPWHTSRGPDIEDDNDEEEDER